MSASELCRREGHPIRTIKATKRFFQCKDCKQRTISLDRLPKRPCVNCGSSNWEKAAMAKVRMTCLQNLKLVGVLANLLYCILGEERSNFAYRRAFASWRGEKVPKQVNNPTLHVLRKMNFA